MSAEVQDVVVPLGLDFEMPQQLWALRSARGFLMCFPIEGEVFRGTWLSEDEAIVALGLVLRIYGPIHRATGIEHSSCLPSPVTLDSLRAEPWVYREPVGAVLLDADLNEKGRRYFR